MKKLDWFIVKKFLGTYIFMIVVVMSISMIFDVSEKLNYFMDPENDLTVFKILIDYYPYFFIHYANLFSSLIVFLSVLWFTSFMAQRLEIVAILSNGVSFWRFSRPYIIASSFLLVISVFVNHYVAPFANKNRLIFENQFTKYNVNFKDVHLEISKGTIVSYRQFIGNTTIVKRLWVENWKQNKNGIWELESDMQVERAEGDSISCNWKLKNTFIRKIGKINDQLVKKKLIDTVLTFNVTDLGQRTEITYAMTTPELIEYKNKEEEKGNSTALIDISRHERTAYPFAAYILTIIGISVASRKSREGVGKNLVIGLFCGLIYIFFMKMTTVAAVNIGLNTIFAVWFPNMFFSIIAMFLYYKRIAS